LLYDLEERFEPGGVPEGHYLTPEGAPVVRRPGSDVTIATLGATLYRALEAADILQQRYGLSAEVIDLRFVAPLDYQPLLDSVAKTGHLLLASDAVERGSCLQTVAATVQNLAFDYLDAPVVVVGARNHITPAPELESLFFPQPEWLLDAISQRLIPLPGHVSQSDFGAAELLRRARGAV
jgi:2-oxoisovalerate dehydrogenase E1 component